MHTTSDVHTCDVGTYLSIFCWFCVTGSVRHEFSPCVNCDNDDAAPKRHTLVCKQRMRCGIAVHCVCDFSVYTDKTPCCRRANQPTNLLWIFIRSILWQWQWHCTESHRSTLRILNGCENNGFWCVCVSMGGGVGLHALQSVQIRCARERSLVQTQKR